jgi:hypothetical protein
VQTRHFSLIAATASLFAFPEFAVSLSCRRPQSAGSNGFGVVSGSAAAIFPAGREFAASLAFAAARRQ